MWAGLRECVRCCGRGWVYRIATRAARKHAEGRVADILAIRWGSQRDVCGKCCGCGFTLPR